MTRWTVIAISFESILIGETRHHASFNARSQALGRRTFTCASSTHQSIGNHRSPAMTHGHDHHEDHHDAGGHHHHHHHHGQALPGFPGPYSYLPTTTVGTPLLLDPGRPDSSRCLVRLLTVIFTSALAPSSLYMAILSPEYDGRLTWLIDIAVRGLCVQCIFCFVVAVVVFVLWI